MTEKVIWICDGCDAEIVKRDGRPTDWKTPLVELHGFQGYPTCAPDSVMQATYHLCPHCARRLYEEANPRNWPRAVKDGPA